MVAVILEKGQKCSVGSILENFTSDIIHFPVASGSLLHAFKGKLQENTKNLKEALNASFIS